MTALLRQMADDLRAIRRLVERQAGRGSFAAALRGLRDRGVITQEDIDRLEEDGTLNAQRPTLNDQCDKGKDE